MARGQKVSPSPQENALFGAHGRKKSKITACPRDPAVLKTLRDYDDRKIVNHCAIVIF